MKPNTGSTVVDTLSTSTKPVTAALSADLYLFALLTQATFLLERRFLLITRLHSALECKHLFACELDFAFSLKITVEY